MKWHLTILCADCGRVIFHAQCEDEKEVQALASEARHRSRRCRILIRPPIGRVYSWD
jgi:transcription initiation factor TFIIIB Brf1 subunit/transcription initiation factor TFIIB